MSYLKKSRPTLGDDDYGYDRYYPTYELHHFDLGEAKKVRQIANRIFGEHNCRNKIDEVRLDVQTWQIDYEGQMLYSLRKEMAEKIAKELDCPIERVKLVGIGYN